MIDVGVGEGVSDGGWVSVREDLWRFIGNNTS